MTGEELKPLGRFEWERLIRRVTLPKGAKFLALMLGTYADEDGSRVRPGVLRLASVMGVSEPTVKRGMAQLRAMGFIERTRQGNRHAGRADEYRLTVPLDVLELDLLWPDECEESRDH